MKVRVLAASAALAVTSFFGLAVSGHTPVASASQIQICGQDGSGYCMNDWNNGGSGNDVKMNNGGTGNEYFEVEPIDRCSGSDNTTSTCPDSYTGPAGDYTAQIVYFGISGHVYCIGTGGLGQGVLTTCNNVGTGTGGGTGTVITVGGANLDKFYDSYESRTNGALECVESGGNVGVDLAMNQLASNGCTGWGYTLTNTW